jgi:mannose-6-phosphate isomerase-like protein (cupin superfamily)
MKHSVVAFKEENLEVPEGYERHARGYRRAVMVDHTTAPAAVHMAHQIVQLEPGGMLETNVIAYEKSLFLLDGELDIMLDDRSYRLVKGDYALVLCGSAHSLRSSTGNGARWLEMIAPQPLAPSVGSDTFFTGDRPLPAIVTGIDAGDARTRYVGHYDDKQLPPPGNLQMDGYSGAGAQGIRQKFMVDRTTGSAHMSMFMVEFAVGGGGSHHTHPFEESYFFLEGLGDCTFEGKDYVVEPLTCCWTGVGAKHAIYARGKAPVKFLETQTPQPPPRQAFRFDSEWAEMRRRYPD